jgi:hypothetical protein
MKGCCVVPISEAIETGAWLKAECLHDRSGPESEFKETNDGKPITFRLRVNAFSRIDLASVDQPRELKCGIDANIWKLDLEVVNLCLRETSTGTLRRRLVIADQDGFEFICCQDSHLCCYSDYSKQAGLNSFYGETLSPKIKRAGAFAYELPEEYDQLFLKIRKGSLTEA